MNDIVKSGKLIEQSAASGSYDPWSKLMKLAEMIEFHEASGTLTVVNGKSRIILRKDGTIRIEGERLVQTASRSMAFNAAKIDLN